MHRIFTKIKLSIMTNLKIGDKAPSFKAKDEQGNTISLADYQGKKLVVFFFRRYFSV